MDQSLINVARTGDMDGLYKLLEQNQFVLEDVDKTPFIDTPLHIAVSAGKTQFSLEIAILKPSFTRKLNKAGLSPMHLALAERNEKIVRGLLAIDNTLIRVKGREGRTPLHDVVVMGCMDLLSRFLSTCPESIEELTIRSETALHLAVIYNQYEAFKELVKCVERLDKKELLNWKDDDGNSALHLATSKNQQQAVKLLLAKKNAGVEINTVNANGQTARDLSEEIWKKTARDTSDAIPVRKIKEILRCEGAKKAKQVPSTDTCWCNKMGKYIQIHWFRYFRFKRLRDSPNDVRNALLVVAVLIATATYQAGLSPPGGVWQDNYVPNFNNTTSCTEDLEHQAGKVIMGHQKFLLFAFFNSAGFYTSLVMIFILTSGFPMRELLNFSLISLLVTYISSMVGISPLKGPYHCSVLSFLLSMPLIFIMLTVLTMMSSRYLFYKLLKKIRELCSTCKTHVEHWWTNWRARDGDLEQPQHPRT